MLTADGGERERNKTETNEATRAQASGKWRHRSRPSEADKSRTQAATQGKASSQACQVFQGQPGPAIPTPTAPFPFPLPLPSRNPRRPHYSLPTPEFPQLMSNSLVLIEFLDSKVPRFFPSFDPRPVPYPATPLARSTRREERQGSEPSFVMFKHVIFFFLFVV